MTPPQTMTLIRNTPDIDPRQQEIYDYVESLEQITQQKVRFSQNQENSFNETALSDHTPEN